MAQIDSTSDLHTPRNAGKIVIAGCGNLLRADDGVGPRLVRRLWEYGPPDSVRLADGGTAGMDIAFQMEGAREVIIIDACQSGSDPGAVFEIPGEEVQTPPLEAMQGGNLHAFRWDHALAFGKWMLKDRYPAKVTVFLIEAAELGYGEDLSEPVRDAMERVAAEIVRRYWT